MMATVFGLSSDLLEGSDHRQVVHDIKQSNVRIGTLLQEPALNIGRLDKWLFPAAIVARNRFVKFIAQTVEKKVKYSDPKTKDVFSVLLSPSSKEKDGRLGPKLAAAEAATFIVAGIKDRIPHTAAVN
jgi:cytochrome P450